MSHEVYDRLALHLSTLGMGMPYTEDLLGILKENFEPAEAEVALALPTKVGPLELVTIDHIAQHISLDREKLHTILEGLAAKGMLFSGTTEDGEKGYALQQVGFGFPQTFFWGGKETDHAKNMASLICKYFSRKVNQEAYGGSETKPFRYVPVRKTIAQSIQAVYPHHAMEDVIDQAKVIAVGHCPCRMTMKLRGKECEHPLEVCLKFDDMAQYVIDRALAREISKEEAIQIIEESEKAGLVHFVDNALGEIKHNCNCCGCSCWNVGTIKRRKIPRDTLMATYFMRETNKEECSGCGICAEICPVDALTIEDGVAVVDDNWCIGCGVCVKPCPSDASALKLRTDVVQTIPKNFKELHEKILIEKGLKVT